MKCKEFKANMDSYHWCIACTKCHQKHAQEGDKQLGEDSESCQNQVRKSSWKYNCCLGPVEEDVKTVFLPPPEYSSTTYSYNKLDSPTFEHHTFHPDSKQTYLDDLEESERKSPWRYEDSSRGSRRYKGTFDNNYADDHIRENGVAGTAYDVTGRAASHDMARQKSVTDMSDRLASRPSSRGGYKTPPPPPVRSSSKGAVDIPHLPSRNYAIEEASPRYVPPPGSLSSFRNNVNVVPNPSYNGPPMRVVSPHNQGSVDDMRGHLV